MFHPGPRLAKESYSRRAAAPGRSTSGESRLSANRICAGVNCAVAPKKYASPAGALHQQGAHEFGWLGRPAADEGFPGRLRGVAAGHAQGAVRDAQAWRRGREGRRITLGHFRDEIGLGRKPRARLVVQREKPVVQQRGVARSDDGGGERLRRRTATEHGVDPDRGGQRKRHRLGRGGISSGLAVSRLRQGWARTGRGAQRTSVCRFEGSRRARSARSGAREGRS